MCVSVCQCFAVLEDGALAHNLQEQESKYIIFICLIMQPYCMLSVAISKLSQPLSLKYIRIHNDVTLAGV